MIRVSLFCQVIINLSELDEFNSYPLVDIVYSSFFLFLFAKTSLLSKSNNFVLECSLSVHFIVRFGQVGDQTNLTCKFEMLLIGPKQMNVNKLFLLSRPFIL